MSRTGQVLAWGFGLLLLASAAVALFVWQTVKDLPDTAALREYTPPLPSTVRDGNGAILTSFSRERRIYLQYEEMPRTLIEAILSAEDKTFFEHDGLDYRGILGAVFTNVQAIGTDKRPVGASTITQQVAKNLLLTNEVSIRRKLQEAVLARRLEEAFSKQAILELYLNQIFLGRNSYGVEAAAQAYFGKGVAGLDLAQIAYLAILPKAPSTYSPTTERGRARALVRRNYVLNQMVANRYITAAEAAAAASEPLVAIPGVAPRPLKVGDYFLEDVRRSLIAKFGETQADGPNSVYGGGLWVRTSIDPVIQAAAEKALRDGLVRYEAGKPWRGPAATIELGDGWPLRLRQARIATGYDEWRPAVVLAKDGDTSRLGFGDGTEGVMPPWAAQRLLRGTNLPAARALKAGDVIPVSRGRDGWRLRQVPEVSGGMVVQDPRTGRVLAMVGGFDARAQSFNRATQAQRQPGSAFKPIVYATALDNGFTPSSIVVDAPYCVFQTRRLGRKCFRNFSGGNAGAQTMRWGLEQSRNLMTVRLGFNAGMDKVVRTARDLGVGDYPAVLAISLGAGETTVLKLTNAYSQLWNGGRKLEPSLIDWVQDRNGKTLYRADGRTCEGCEGADWAGEAMPRPGGTPKQVIDARTAYQIVHLMEGVVTRGTAMGLSSMNRPLAGKTGTTNGPNDVWFIGGTPEMIAGLYIGYDRPRSLGGYAQGGTVAVPIWRAFGETVLKDAPKLPFPVAPGVRMVTIERRSGKRVFGATPTDERRSPVIWEAFKPASEPRRTGRARPDEMLAQRSGRPVRSDSEFLRNSGGIY